MYPQKKKALQIPIANIQKKNSWNRLNLALDAI